MLNELVGCDVSVDLEISNDGGKTWEKVGTVSKIDIGNLGLSWELPANKKPAESDDKAGPVQPGGDQPS